MKEEAERTERSIRRLTVEITPSCCLSEKWRIINLLDDIWMLLPEVESLGVRGRPQCDKCGCRVRNCSQHRFTTLETISNFRNSYPGFSSGRPRGTTPQMTGTLSYRPEETGGRQREKSPDTRHRRLDDRYRVYRGHEDCGGGLFARRPVRCVPLTPAHRRRGVLCGAGNTGIGETVNGDEYFADENRFSLSSDSHRMLCIFPREGEAAIIPRTSLKGTGMEVAVFSFGEAS
ncbi:hypothetical protein TNCV_222061 [Trichonephila clavipes]|nr:hypothetical protein TNCV_222061 [Trichonephila clavipes]